MPPISRMVISPLTSPLNVRSTARVVSVQIALPIATGVDRTTAPETTTGDFVISWASVGRTIVVAEAAAATSVAIHVTQYARK